MILVSESSGCLDVNASSDKYPMHRTHFDINKFGSPDEQAFRVLRYVIQEMAKRRPGVSLQPNSVDVSRRLIPTHYV